MHNREIEKRTAEFLGELDVEFQQRPVYPIILDSDVPPFFVPCGDVKGWSSPFCDLLARQLLEHQGRWRGRGFAFFMVPPPANDWTDPSWLGMVCHEGGHYLTCSDEVCSLDLDNELECIRRALAPQATVDVFKERAKAEDFWEYSESVTRKHHPPEWIRATLHLVHRSRWRAAAHTAAATSAYGYAPGFVLDAILGAEADELRDIGIRLILRNNPPPNRFVELTK